MCAFLFFPIQVRLTELPELNSCATPSVPPYLTKHGVEQRANPCFFGVFFNVICEPQVSHFGCIVCDALCVSSDLKDLVSCPEPSIFGGSALLVDFVDDDGPLHRQREGADVVIEGSRT